MKSNRDQLAIHEITQKSIRNQIEMHEIKQKSHRNQIENKWKSNTN